MREHGAPRAQPVLSTERLLQDNLSRWQGEAMILHVESRPGLHGDPEPLAFLLGDKRSEVLHIVDRWIARDCSYFKIQASDRGVYILRYTPSERQWELTLFQAPSD